MTTTIQANGVAMPANADTDEQLRVRIDTVVAARRNYQIAVVARLLRILALSPVPLTATEVHLVGDFECRPTSVNNRLREMSQRGLCKRHETSPVTYSALESAK